MLPFLKFVSPSDHDYLVRSNTVNNSLYKEPKQSIFWNIHFASLLSISAPLCGCGLEVWTCEPKASRRQPSAHQEAPPRFNRGQLVCCLHVVLLLLHCAMFVFCFALLDSKPSECSVRNDSTLAVAMSSSRGFVFPDLRLPIVRQGDR